MILMAPALAGADDDDDDGGGGGGGDRAFCAPAGTPEPGQCSFSPSGTIDFDASSGPLGENPMGTLREDFDPFFYSAQLTCLQVAGNQASFAGTVTASNVPWLIPGITGIAYTVIDNGPGAIDTISLGTVLPGGGPPPNTANCGSTFALAIPVEGDIVVQDNIAGGGDDDDDDDGADDDD
jgi:hypothetical protein